MIIYKVLRHKSRKTHDCVDPFTLMFNVDIYYLGHFSDLKKAEDRMYEDFLDIRTTPEIRYLPFIQTGMSASLVGSEYSWKIEEESLDERIEAKP